jgi:hypothetical protein
MGLALALPAWGGQGCRSAHAAALLQRELALQWQRGEPRGTQPQEDGACGGLWPGRRRSGQRQDSGLDGEGGDGCQWNLQVQ